MISAEARRSFADLVQRTGQIVLTTHINPDGDALGSQVSLALFLRSQGKQVRVVNNDATAKTLRFVESAEAPVEVYDPDTHDPVLAAADLIILVDNSAPDRLGKLETRLVGLASKVLCIDHHPSRDTPWGHHVLDEAACATTVMIHELTGACGWKPTRVAAQAIYVGLATDTGFFRFNSTNARAHEVAAEMLRLGAEPARAYQQVFERNSVALTRLMGHGLAGLRMLAGGRVACVQVTREMLERVQAGDIDTSEITTPMLAIEGVGVAVLFREQDDGRVKVSLRSKGKLDVHRLAAEFGGGGHRNASGIVMEGKLDDVVATVTQRIVEHLSS